MKPSILVVSHERSGTHYLINSIAKNFGYSHRPDSILGSPSMLLSRIREFHGNETIFKCHHQHQFLAPIMGEINKLVKVIYIRRNGRDTLTSCFHYMKANRTIGCFPKTKSFTEFIHEKPYLYPFDACYTIEKSSNMPERWARHVKGWMHNAFYVRFEEMKNSFEQAMCRIARYIGLDHKGPWVEPTILDFGVNNRKGIIGDYVNVFSPEDIGFFNDEVLMVMRGR